MRISNLIRGIENLTINTGARLAEATGTLYGEIEAEAAVRAAYRAESREARALRLDELRSLMHGIDTMAVERAAEALLAERAAVALAAEVEAQRVVDEALAAKRAASAAKRVVAKTKREAVAAELEAAAVEHRALNAAKRKARAKKAARAALVQKIIHPLRKAK